MYTYVMYVNGATLSAKGGGAVRLRLGCLPRLDWNTFVGTVVTGPNVVAASVYFLGDVDFLRVPQIEVDGLKISDAHDDVM
jgi:hypothetical protein